MPKSRQRFNIPEFDWRDNEAILEARAAHAAKRPEWWYAMPNTMEGYVNLHGFAMSFVSSRLKHLPIQPGPDLHMVVVQPGSLEVFNQQMLDEIRQSRIVRGADLKTGLLPKREKRT